MTVSVLVVNWNRKELLRNCLNSLISQETNTADQAAGFEITVIDNSSTDGSVEMLRDEFPQVTVIENTSNTGFCAANNQGFALARGQFIALEQ